MSFYLVITKNILLVVVDEMWMGVPVSILIFLGSALKYSPPLFEKINKKFSFVVTTK